MVPGTINMEGKVKKLIGVIMTSVLLTLSLAGCGGSGAAAPAAPASQEAPAESTAETKQDGDIAEDTDTQEAAAESTVPQELTDLFVGEWMDRTSQRAGMEITEGEYTEEKDFCVKISWAGSYADAMVWEMNLEYDPATGQIAYENGRKAQVTYNEDGSIANEDVQWENSKGAFTVEGSELHWTDSNEEDAADFVFERVYAYDLTASDYLDNIFKTLINVEIGTAGTSLKQAVAAEEILSYVAGKQLWNTEASARRTAFNEAWNSLSSEEKALVKRNLFEEEIAELIDGTFNDYESVRERFRDCGADEEMKELSENVYARRSWNTLRKLMAGLE